MSITYRYRFGERVWVHRIHDVTQDRYGLFQGRVTWMTEPNNWQQAVPSPFSSHPLFNWLEMERWSMRSQGPFVAIEAEYFGIDGQRSESTYELSNAAGEFPIESHPNFAGILSGAGLTRSDVVDEDDRFIGFPVRDNYPNGRNLSGVEAFLGFGEVVWRQIWNDRQQPGAVEIAEIGKISSPTGNPPTPANRNWILITNSYTQRGKTFSRTREWKLSGPQGANPDIYG